MRKNDNYQGKIAFWEKQYDLAQQGKSKYSLTRCVESLQHFRRMAQTTTPPQPQEHTIKHLLRSMEEDAQYLKDMGEGGDYVPATKVRTLSARIQKCIMQIEESIGI